MKALIILEGQAPVVPGRINMPIPRIDYDTAMSIVHQFKEIGVTTVSISGPNEQTKWPGIDIFVERLWREGIKVELVTEGSNMNELRIKAFAKQLNKITFQVWGATPDTHIREHGIKQFNFNTIIDNIKDILKQARAEDSNILVEVVYKISKTNYEELNDAVKLYARLGVDVMRLEFKKDELTEDERIAIINRTKGLEENMILEIGKERVPKGSLLITSTGAVYLTNTTNVRPLGEVRANQLKDLIKNYVA